MTQDQFTLQRIADALERIATELEEAGTQRTAMNQRLAAIEDEIHRLVTATRA